MDWPSGRRGDVVSAVGAPADGQAVNGKIFPGDADHPEPQRAGLPDGGALLHEGPDRVVPLVLRTDWYDDPVQVATRQLIESQGYDIVANVGDQLSDLEGGFADRTFKLPNPMCFLP